MVATNFLRALWRPMPPDSLPRLQNLSRRLLALEGYGIEAILSVCSVWAACSLWWAPDSFAATYGVYFSLLAKINDHTDHWAIFAAAAALLKLVGLAACLLRFRSHDIGLTARCIGLAMSGVFWALAGMSSVMANPTTIGGIPMTIMGVAAWWTLIRFPAMPHEPYRR